MVMVLRGKSNTEDPFTSTSKEEEDTAERAAGIQLQPNPAQTSVQLHGLQTRASYRISDLAGRELLRGVTDPGQSISVDGLASGLYHFSWQTGSGPWTALPLRVQ